MGPGEPELITFACHLTSTIGIRVSWDPFNPAWIASAVNTELAQVMIDTQHPIYILHNNAQTRATVAEIREEDKWVNMQTEHGETFLMKTEGQDITSGYPTLPHPGTAFTTNRAKPRIWPRGGQSGQEKDRMVPSNLSSPGSTSGTEEPHSVKERGRRP